jgi:signal transduction histidine kinase
MMKQEIKDEIIDLSSFKTKILIVDDLKDNLLALDGLLRRNDLEIYKAGSGVEALELMVLHEFALALLDVQMPGMSGFELAELMRGTNQTKNIPIIFVTATATSQSFLFKGYETGAVDFLLKPLDMHSVKSKVNIFVELYRYRREQDLLLIALKKTKVELEQAVLIRDEFISIASHELKTPLTSLLLQSQLRKRILKKEDAVTFTKEKLLKIFESDEVQIVRINHLIDNMLDIARVTSGKLTLNLERFDLCVLVRDLLDRYSELALAANCNLTTAYCESAFGTWDHFRVEQVVTNLFTNALRYGSSKPIHIQVNCNSSYAQIRVVDNGGGIADENHDRIFRRFERAVTGSEINGLGLGLYIVKQILEAHHGLIRVESKLGEGATFIAELPLFNEV